MYKNLLATLLLFNFSFCEAGQSWLSKPSENLPGAINGASGNLYVSSNGQYLSYASIASNWVTGDQNAIIDVFVHDLSTGTTQLASTSSGGQQLIDSGLAFISQVSDDGQTILMLSSSLELPAADGNLRVYSKDLNSGLVINESEYNGGSYFDTTYMFMSADGSAMLFSTQSMIDPLHTSGNQQVYLKNLSNDDYTLISTSANGLAEADDDSVLIGLSPNGRYVLLRTTADNVLGTALTNSQLILKDLDDDSYELITQQPNGDPTVTSGLYDFGYVSNAGAVVFRSNASDLVVNDTNNEDDLFLYQQDQVVRISVSQSGNQVSNPSINYFAFSGDGQTAVFVSKSDELIPGLNIDPADNNINPVYRYNITTGELTVLTTNDDEVTPGSVSSLALSQDGEFWLLSSHTGLPGINALTGDENNGVIYQYNAGLATFSRPLTVAYDPNTIISNMDQPLLSSDQRWVLTASTSPNLSTEQNYEFGSSLLLLDRYSNEWQVIGRNIRNFALSNPEYDISASGRYVVFKSNYFQPNGEIDLGTTQMFLLDRDTGIYSQFIDGQNPRVNDDGFVVFSTFEALVSEDQNDRSDVYYYDPNTFNLELISINPNTLNAGNNSSQNPDIGGSGANARVTFMSRATDLTANPDVNGRDDIFTTLLNPLNIQRISEVIGTGGDGTSSNPSISNQGNTIVYNTRSVNLTADDYSGAGNVQLLSYDVGTATNTLVSFNQSNQPNRASLGFFDYGMVSDSGRFVTYFYKDNGLDLDFSGDDDNVQDVVLVDMMTQQSTVISDFYFAGYNTDPAHYAVIAEDVSQDPPLVGVAFNSGRLLSLLAESPGHQEIYMHQQGGGDTTITIQVQGLGTVSGSFGVNCQDQCSYDIANGNSVSLVASPDAGQVFHAWQDALSNCETTNPACLIEVDDRPQTLTAIFLDQNDLIFRNSFE